MLVMLWLKPRAAQQVRLPARVVITPCAGIGYSLKSTCYVWRTKALSALRTARCCPWVHHRVATPPRRSSFLLFCRVFVGPRHWLSVLAPVGVLPMSTIKKEVQYRGYVVVLYDWSGKVLQVCFPKGSVKVGFIRENGHSKEIWYTLPE